MAVRDWDGIAQDDCLTDDERRMLVREAGVTHRDPLCHAALHEAMEILSRKKAY